MTRNKFGCFDEKTRQLARIQSALKITPISTVQDQGLNLVLEVVTETEGSFEREEKV